MPSDEKTQVSRRQVPGESDSVQLMMGIWIEQNIYLWKVMKTRVCFPCSREKHK